jgi:hypothetical protein
MADALPNPAGALEKLEETTGGWSVAALLLTAAVLLLCAFGDVLPGSWNRIAKMSEYVEAYRQAYEEVGDWPAPRSLAHPAHPLAHTPPAPARPHSLPLAGAAGPRQQHPQRPQGAGTRGAGRKGRRAR